MSSLPLTLLHLILPVPFDHLLLSGRILFRIPVNIQALCLFRVGDSPRIDEVRVVIRHDCIMVSVRVGLENSARLRLVLVKVLIQIHVALVLEPLGKVHIALGSHFPVELLKVESSVSLVLQQQLWIVYGPACEQVMRWVLGLVL